MKRYILIFPILLTYLSLFSAEITLTINKKFLNFPISQPRGPEKNAIYC
ncbi:Uncharacterised protein [Sphingobacterium daejeonense]|nr:Uncharacterised protein [Sphingobacterium daejeonense]